MTAGLLCVFLGLFWALRLPPWEVGTIRVAGLSVGWWWAGGILYLVLFGVALMYVYRMGRWEKEKE